MHVGQTLKKFGSSDKTDSRKLVYTNCTEPVETLSGINAIVSCSPSILGTGSQDALYYGILSVITRNCYHRGTGIYFKKFQLLIQQSYRGRSVLGFRYVCTFVGCKFSPALEVAALLKGRALSNLFAGYRVIIKRQWPDLIQASLWSGTRCWKWGLCVLVPSLQWNIQGAKQHDYSVSMSQPGNIVRQKAKSVRR